MMDFLRMTSDNSQPKRRRRQNTVSGVNNIIKNNMSAFLSFFQETLKVANHRPTLKQNQQSISLNFKMINNIIDKIDDHINNRMNQYESQIYSIIKGQIQQMHKQNLKLIQILNKKIQSKQSQQQMFNINNQLDYFKSQALKLFNQCKKLRIQVKMLEKINKQHHLERQNNNLCMRKMKKKYLKQKCLRNKIDNDKNKYHQFQQTKKPIQKNQRQKRVKTMMDFVGKQSISTFKRSANKIETQDNKIKDDKKKDDKQSSSNIDEIDLDELLDDPGFTDRTPLNTLPALNLKKIDSQVYFEDISLGITANKFIKKDQSVQTEQRNTNQNVKDFIGLSIHPSNRRGFMQKSAINTYKMNPSAPYVDFKKMQMKVEKQKTPNIDKMMSESFTKNRIAFGLSKDRYIQQKTFHYS